MKLPTCCLGLALLSLSGCDPETSTKGAFDIAFSAQTDDGTPLSGVELSTGKKRLGVTDEGGTFAVRIHGSAGATLGVNAQCPEGYDSPQATSVRLVEIKALGEGAARPIEHSSTCVRQERDVVVVVHAKQGAGLPVLVDGEVLSTTDALGNALLYLRRHRDVEKISVSIDTSSQPRLQPENPSRVFLPQGRDAIALFDQTFTEAKPVKRAPARTSSPRRHVPYRMN